MCFRNPGFSLPLDGGKQDGVIPLQNFKVPSFVPFHPSPLPPGKGKSTDENKVVLSVDSLDESR